MAKLDVSFDNGIPTYKVPGEAGRRRLAVTGNSNTGAPAGSVTQLSTRATGVTLNALSGTITTDTTSLAAEASAVFVVTNSTVKIGDVPLLAIRSGKIALNTEVIVDAVANGSFSIRTINGNVAAGIAETGAIVINFVILKSLV